jgi:hypothetical protein
MIALYNFPLAYCLALAISKPELHRALTGPRTLRQTRSLALAIAATQGTHSDPQDFKLGLTDKRRASRVLASMHHYLRLERSARC